MISIYFGLDTYICVSSDYYVGAWMASIPSAIEDHRRYSFKYPTHSCFDPECDYPLIAQAPTIDDFYLNYPELFL